MAERLVDRLRRSNMEVLPICGEAAYALTALEGALKRLSFAAQITGGTAGRDENLVAAIDEADAALSLLRGDGQ